MITWMTKDDWFANYDKLKESTTVPLMDEIFSLRIPYTELEELLNFPAHQGDGSFGDEPGPVMIFCGFRKNLPIVITCHEPYEIYGTQINLPVSPEHSQKWLWQNGLEMLTCLDSRVFKTCTWVRSNVEEVPKVKYPGRYHLHNQGEEKPPIYMTNKMEDALDLRAMLIRLGHQQKLEITVKNMV